MNTNILKRSPPSSPHATLNSPGHDPVTSGFGSLMDQEHVLQASILKSLGKDNGPHATAISRILIQQQTWINSNIRLLARRFERLPHPSRFRGYHAWPHPLSNLTSSSSLGGTLALLIAQHERLLCGIEEVMEPPTPGTPDDPLLREVAHNHREMAWMLTALLNDDETLRNSGPTAADATNRGRADEVWENEGGAVSD